MCVVGDGEADATKGRFVDEYGQKLEVTSTRHDLGKYSILEFEHRYLSSNWIQRSLLVLMPCDYAFSNPKARGFIAHRIVFFEKNVVPLHGKLQIEDYGAESMSLKRVLENRAGNLASFNKGMSYLAEAVA